MFEGFKSNDDSLTKLDISSLPRHSVTPKPRADAAAKPEAKAPVPQICVAQTLTLEGALQHFGGAQRKLGEMVRTGLRPELLFYIVFPQPGLTHSIPANNGTNTIVPIFNSKMMAEAYIAGKKIAGAVAAVCRAEKLAQQAEKWSASGINSFSLNACCRCFGMMVFPLSDLEAEDKFLTTWRVDLANRRQFAESYGRNASAVFATNRKQARIWLEGIRDHIDCANPYLHWMIALLAGLDGDMKANAASIKRLEAFGPQFVGKLQGTSFDFSEPGSQMSTFPEAVVGLGVSLGYLDPSKVKQEPRTSADEPGDQPGK